MSTNAWRVLVVFGASMQFLATTGSVYNYNVFFVDLQEEFRESAVFTGWVGSLCSALYCCAAPLGAVIGSKIGNVRVLFAGLILESAGFLFTSFIPSLAFGYLTFGFVAGLGSGLVIFAAGSLMLEWYSGRGSCCRASGVVMIGGSVGVMTFGPLLNTLNAAWGWRNSLRFLSVTVLSLGTVGALPFFKSPENHPKRSVPSTEERGPDGLKRCAEDGMETSSLVHADTVADPQVVICRDPKGVNVGISSRETMKSLVLNVEAWLFIASSTFAQFGWSFVIINFRSFMEGIKLPTWQVSLTLMVVGAGELGGKLLFAACGDRLPCLKLYVIAATSVCGAVASGFQTICTTFQHMVILSVVWGIARGGIYAACFPAGDELFKVYSSRVVTSVVLTGFGIGDLIGSSVTGALYELTGDYRLGLFVLVISFALSSASMLLIPASRKIRWHRRVRLGKTDDNDEKTEAETTVCEKVKPMVRSVGTSNPELYFQQ